MILLVGGNARNVGKTTLVKNIIAATRDTNWVAVKISGHPHGDARPRLPKHAKPPATELFAEAGAAETFLLHETPEERMKFDALADSGRPLIVESNRAVEWVRGEFAYLFVWDPEAENAKPRERWHLEKAAWVLPPRQDPDPALLAWITTRISDWRDRPGRTGS